jgi:hypothetical protein
VPLIAMTRGLVVAFVASIVKGTSVPGSEL